MWRRMDSGEEGQGEMQTVVGRVVGGQTAQTSVSGWGDWVEGKGEGESERERERERERHCFGEWMPAPHFGLVVARKFSSTLSSSLCTSVYMLVLRLSCHHRVHGVDGGL